MEVALVASKAVEATVCDRCYKPTPATTMVQFCMGDHTYELDLCEQHAGLWEQDLLAWVRLAREATRSHGGAVAPAWTPGARFAPKVELPELPPKVHQEHRNHISPDQLAFPVALSGLVQDPRLPPDHTKWTFSGHAKERMAERGLTDAEVLWAASRPTNRYPGREPELHIHERDGVKVAVNRKRKVIVTAARRGQEDG